MQHSIRDVCFLDGVDSYHARADCSLLDNDFVRGVRAALWQGGMTREEKNELSKRILTSQGGALHYQIRKVSISVQSGKQHAHAHA